MQLEVLSEAAVLLQDPLRRNVEAVHHFFVCVPLDLLLTTELKVKGVSRRNSRSSSQDPREGFGLRVEG